MTAKAIENIRNFSIVAHIDHGKSTLADRLIQLTGGLEEREMVEQVLDSMDIERERGITIKAQTVRLKYRAKDGQDYVLNLIDTPGHVDFAYEVSRSLAACEGSLLVVDASQGVEAQTLANAYHAINANHEIIPVLNKIDLPSAEPERVCKEIEDVVGIDTSEAIKVSAKTGVGIDDLLEAMVKRLPPPKGDRNAPLKALLVDSWYDPYLGVVTLVRVQDGVLKKGMRIRMMAVGAAYDLDKVGIFSPKPTDVAELGPGEIGFIIAGIKTIADCKVGDTITEDRMPATEPLPGFKPSIPVVWCGLYPVDADDFEDVAEVFGRPEAEGAAAARELLRLAGERETRADVVRLRRGRERERARLLVERVLERVILRDRVTLVHLDVVARCILVVIDREAHGLLAVVDPSGEVADHRVEFALFRGGDRVGDRDDGVGCHVFGS